MNQIKKLIEGGKLGMDPKMLGLTSLNPYSPHNSASRGVMYLGMISQCVPINKAEVPITLSGLEKEMAKTLLAKYFKNDSKILDIVYKYKGDHFGEIDYVIGANIIYLDLFLDEINTIYIPHYEKYHSYFGYEHKPTSVLKNLSIDDIVKAGSKLTRTNSESKEGLYQYGVNLNVLMTNIPEIGEDAIVISKSAAKKFGFKIYETKRFSFGGDTIPLNLYGDSDNYKIMPDIGEYIGDDGILVATRDYDDELYPCLMSNKALQIANPIFDKCAYARGPGGRVVNIEVIHAPKSQKHKIFTRTSEQAMRYANAFNKYKRELKESGNKHFNAYDGAFPIGNELHVEMVREMMQSSDKTIKAYKQEILNTFTIEITLEYNMVIGNGYKLTGNSGDKGIVSYVIDDEKMPIDDNGVRVEIMFGPLSTIARNNPGRLYESYLNYSSRMVKKKIVEMVNGRDVEDLNNKEFDAIFNKVLSFIKHLNDKQYNAYKTSPKNKRVDIVKDIIKNELYFLLPIGEKKLIEVVTSLQNSEFKTTATSIDMELNGVRVKSEEPVLVGTMYIMLLSKIADSGLVCNTPKLNHFGVPISSSKIAKQRLPWHNNATKILSETETRLFASYLRPDALIELRDRSVSLTSQRLLYKGILEADNPSNIDRIINREEHPYGDDEILKIVRKVFNASGVDLVTEK